MSDDTTSTTIAIVDDDEARRYSKARALRRVGYEVVEAGTIAEGWAMIHQGHPRLAILDIGLPDGDGRDLCRRLKANPASASVAVLQISATFVTEADTVAALESGADGSLVEPIEPTVLVATVRAMLRARQAEEDARAALVREKVARAAAEDANRIKDDFLAVLSHELRSPLGVILTWVTLLRSGKVDPARSEQGLETIERNARLQSKLIEDLLDVSRIISGTTVLDTSLVELGPILEGAMESVRVAAEAKGIRIESIVDDSVGPLNADPVRMQQVIWNLLSNAVKFTPNGGTIRVEIQRAGSQVMIRVTDSGQGIPAEFLPHVFERFRQADSSTTRNETGLGLGLAIVRHIVELHGGTVRAESGGLGTGATFTVLVPLPAVRSPAQPSPSNLRRAGPETLDRLDGLRVLVVDDESDARGAIVAVLEEGGAVVTSSDSVASAVVELGATEFDAVVSDIGMPVEDGYGLIRRLREMAAAKDRPVRSVALTAYANTAEVEKILRAGFDAALTKPIEAKELIAQIARLTHARSSI